MSIERGLPGGGPLFVFLHRRRPLDAEAPPVEVASAADLGCPPVMDEAGVHVIEDWRRPRLPFAMKALNAVGAPFARGLVSLEPGRLLDAAAKETGLNDFGDERFLEPLGVLTSALEKEVPLHALGRFGARQLLLQLLRSRLRVEALIRVHPEIEREEIRAPIFIVGLPRTGTTHLHNLIAQDPALRSLPYWESMDPVPADLARGEVSPDDPRIRACQQACDFLHRVAPLFPLMHEMAPHEIHEEVQLLAIDLSTMLFEASYPVPTYRDWYRATDQTASYAYLKRLLKVLQWLRGGERWILKSPQHLEQLGPLLAVFPDATIVQTHRDPVRVTASFATLGAYGLRMSVGAIDPHVVGRYWADRIELMLNASVSDRDGVPKDQVVDCRFHEFMDDQMGMLRRIYAAAGQPFSQTAEAKFESYLANRTRGRMGRIDYRLEDFGLEAGERREALGHYQARFEVPDEA